MIDRKKLQNDIVGAISNAAQHFLDATSDPQRQKAAGKINGLADMLDDIFSIAGDGELRAAFDGDMLQDQRLADDADTAGSVRYHTAAANEISAVIRIMDAWTEIKKAKAEYDTVMKKYQVPSPVIANEVVGHEDEPVEQGVVEEAPLEITAQPVQPDTDLPPTPSGRRHPVRVPVERVKVDDVIVWSACRGKDGEEIPFQDLVDEFYAKPGRDARLAHSAAQNALYVMEKRGCAEIGRVMDGNRKRIRGYVVTRHGRFEAERLTGPVFQCDSGDQPAEKDLLKEYGHLKEDAE